MKQVLFLLLIFLNGCASMMSDTPGDPLENFNRPVYTFNRALDKVVLRPVTKVYTFVTPDPLEDGVSNFFDNLGDIVTTVNGLLQGKFSQSGSDSLRFVVNTTFGLLGLFDVASSWGLEKHDEDFGQTLGYWGFNSGAYIMLPLFGPSNLRDGVGLVPDYLLDPYTYSDHVPTKNTVTGFRLLNKRASLLQFDSQLEESIDEYAFIRDAYMQNRQFKVYDGNPPDDDEWLDEECFEEDEDCEEECLEEEDCDEAP